MMVWGSNFKHSSVRLEETIYIKYLCYIKSIQWTEKDGLQEIQNKAIEIAFFAVLTVLCDSILGDVLIHSQSSRESFPGLCKNYAARKRVFSVSLRFASFILPVFMGWGKRQTPLISPLLASVNFTKFRIPPPLSFELKTMSPIHPLVFPDIFPWLARGPTPGASR